MWDPCCECCEGMTGCDARTESGPVSDWDGPGPTQAALHWAQCTVHLVMRHNHHSVSAFIILEILIRKEEVNRLAEGVLKIALAFVLFWLFLTDSTLRRWSAEQKPRHLPKCNLVSTTSTQYFYFDHPHTLRSLHLQQPTTNMDKHMLQTSMIMFIWIN